MTEQPITNHPVAAVDIGALRAVDDNPETRLAQLEQLVASVAYHDDQAKRHADASKAAKHAIMLLHQQRGKTVELEDGTKVTWKNPSRSFDATAFQAAYPAEANDYLYETRKVLDTAAIPPKLKDQYMKDGAGDGSIIIK